MLQRLGFLLQRCTKSGDLHIGRRLHAVLFKIGFDGDVILSNHLIHLYARCGTISAARRLFETMPHRNLVSWSTIISGCDKAGESSAALALFAEIPFLPNEHVYASAITASARQFAIEVGRQIHASSVKTGHATTSFVCNSLISLYMKCGFPDDALIIFAGMPGANLVSFNAMIGGYADNFQFTRGLELFRHMNRRGLRADRFTLVAVMAALSSAVELSAVHCLAVKIGLDSCAFAGNAILALYSKYGSLQELETAFRLIEDKDIVSWNTMMAACSRHGDHAESLHIFRAGIKYGAEVDGYALAGALAASAGLASLKHGGQIHARILRTGAGSSADVALHNALMNMYAKCGKMGCAEIVFRLLPDKSLVSWNTMIAAAGSNGLGVRALRLFEEMVAVGAAPDSCSFSALLTACSHSGMVEEGRALYDAMAQVFGINPGVEHLSSLIDLLGRAGRLEEAETYLEAASIPPEEAAVMRGSLLSSCRIHGDLIAGRRTAERLLERRPTSSSPYVLLSSLYALAGRWGEACDVRRLLRGSGLRKEPGHSLVDVDGPGLSVLCGHKIPP